MKNNISAYPCYDILHDSFGKFAGLITKSSGMTLRDWFAGQALNGITSGNGIDWTQVKGDVVAGAAYEFADAMLAERAKQEAGDG